MNAEARIRAVFENVLADGTPWRHPNAPISIVATKGRCVHVRLSGSPEWVDLFEDLLGDCNPCTEFRLAGRNLYARLKTDEQLAADYAAMDFDERHGEFHTHGFPDFESKPAKPKREKDTRGKWEKALEKFIRASGETTFRRLPLLEEFREQPEGQGIRLDNLNREFKKLVGRVIEEVEGGDGEEFSLIENEEK